MPWLERDTMSLRSEFVQMARQQSFSFAELCRRFRISRKTGYKWLQRYILSGRAALADRSRRPLRSPRRTHSPMENMLVELRQTYPAWGARKLRKVLERRGMASLPATSTITAILHRHQLITPAESAAREPYQRFERAAPNELWQMDFKGHFQTDQGRCHPLTVVDDHSRYALAVEACANEQGGTVQQRLTRVFQRYGLPQEILCDNGSPWGAAGYCVQTEVTVWLLRLGVRTIHGRPAHPQTQGKDERFHRTIKAEVLTQRFADLEQCQTRFDGWRQIYNWERPHEALQLAVPGERYRPSPRRFPQTLPPIEYAPDVAVRQVDDGGRLRWQGRDTRVGRAFSGLPLGVRATALDGVFEVYFCAQLITTLDFRETCE